MISADPSRLLGYISLGSHSRRSELLFLRKFLLSNCECCHIKSNMILLPVSTDQDLKDVLMFAVQVWIKHRWNSPWLRHEGESWDANKKRWQQGGFLQDIWFFLKERRRNGQIKVHSKSFKLISLNSLEEVDQYLYPALVYLLFWHIKLKCFDSYIWGARRIHIRRI